MGNWGRRWIFATKKEMELREKKFLEDLERARKLKKMSKNKRKLYLAAESSNSLEKFI